MLLNSPLQLPVGSTIGSDGSAALRTAFGDLSSLFVSASGNLNFVYNTKFPEDLDGGILGLNEKVVQKPVSRIY